MLSVSGPTLVLPVVFIPTDYRDYSHRILASDAKNFDVIPFITYTHIDSFPMKYYLEKNVFNAVLLFYKYK